MDCLIHGDNPASSILSQLSPVYSQISHVSYEEAERIHFAETEGGGGDQ